ILAGEDIESIIREMIDETIGDAVADYLSGDYPQRCMAEWVRHNLELNLRPDQIRGRTIEDFPALEADLHNRAAEEATNVINVTIGEYADEELDPKEWDLKGLSSWAMSRFKVNLPQNQLRRMTPAEMERSLAEAAAAHIESIDLTELQQFLTGGFAVQALAESTRSKFGLEIPPAELPENDLQEAEQKIARAVEGAYLRREIEYPCRYAIDITVGQSGSDNVYALGALCDWANRKFEAGWDPEKLSDKSVDQLFGDLVALAEGFFTGERLSETVKTFLSGLNGTENVPEIVEWCQKRFDTDISADDLAGDVESTLTQAGRAFLRRELTELERFVLLQIYDTSWKDHLLAMDHLRSSVGLRSYAEQDPRIVYKREGFRQFSEML
ncbi:MAG: hypothetical protein KAV00_04410, partial [Phycisphaerae bacterium]|nr:hypothetical protein [Phycisphaerae bacterium]